MYLASVRKKPTGTQPATSNQNQHIHRNIFALGFTSLFTDISSEMIVAITPLYLTSALGFSYLSYGLFEGAYQGANASLRLWGGALSDRHQNHKRIAATGYGISAFTRVGLFLTSFLTWLPITLFLLADRVGKGLRVAPRDALISLSVSKDRLATAFGAHRAMDTFGALLGPIVAYLLLEVTPGAYESVFAMSVATAFIGLSFIIFLAQQPVIKTKIQAKKNLLASLKQTLADSNTRLVCLAVAAVSFMTISDSFLYLIIFQESSMDKVFFPLLFSGTAVTYLVLAVPIGSLADKFSKTAVFLAGNLFLLAAYILLLTTSISTTIGLATLGLLGVYYAATDGVVPAIISSLTPEDSRGVAIASSTLAISLGKLIAAPLFGLLWQQFGLPLALSLFSGGLFITLVFAYFSLSKIQVAHA